MAQVNLRYVRGQSSLSLETLHGLLISLGRVFERTEDVRVRATFDAVDKVADFAEEGVIVGECV